MKRIGIIGGGQLARMMIYESQKLNFHFSVLDPAEHPPAAGCANRHIRGGLYDGQFLREIVETSDVSTYDIEHIETGILQELESEGHIIEPAPRILSIIQDKYIQKKTFADAGLPLSPFQAVEGPEEIDMQHRSFPFVQKARTGGYDGRGVAVIQGPEDTQELLSGPSCIEDFVSIEKELAVMVARTSRGEIYAYPAVEMIFLQEANICSEVIAPANIDPATQTRSVEIAEAAVDILGGSGVYGVELFLTTEGDILLNEIAPRPHNSGHYTIEACFTSQFEQHIRAVAGLPLGNTALQYPAVMINLLGSEGASGPASINGIEKALSIPGCSIHVYGKTTCRPFRKMGHATFIGDPSVLHPGSGKSGNLQREIETLRKRAKQVNNFLKIGGKHG